LTIHQRILRVPRNHGHEIVEEPLNGRSILIVEDDVLLATDLTVFLRGLGVRVAHSAPSVPAALSAMVHYVFDAAVLDVNLQDEWVFPVANALQRAEIPFLFLTAYAPASIPAQHRERPFLQKPYNNAMLAEALRALVEPAYERALPAPANDHRPKSA
jgi:CheY-like chemotaxis protein